MYPGGIETQIWSNLARDGISSLKADSLYKPIEKEANNMISGAFIENSPAAPWAAGVAERVTRKSPPSEIWTGKGASLIYWINCLAPRWLVDLAWNATTGLNKLTGRLQREKAD